MISFYLKSLKSLFISQQLFTNTTIEKFDGVLLQVDIIPGLQGMLWGTDKLCMTMEQVKHLPGMYDYICDWCMYMCM